MMQHDVLFAFVSPAIRSIYATHVRLFAHEAQRKSCYAMSLGALIRTVAKQRQVSIDCCCLREGPLQCEYYISRANVLFQNVSTSFMPCTWVSATGKRLLNRAQ